ncbi:hypothetical protein PYW07_001583 [Mythimna separata]|uniref:Ionotropic receptor 7d n=1 Tax=Mythimna separata TaxID=271217 RepID=A0AAD7YUW6_MYTSE|nr:hypothetical protein PYW07_001583 [Mythimna separata]
MAAKVALQNFDLRHTTLLFFNSTLCYGVEIFLRFYHYNIVVNRATLKQNALIQKSRQFVLFASDVADVEQLLDAIIEIEMDNTGKFIIICESPVQVECDEKDIMDLCWNYRIVNIVFIRLEATEAIGFTYYPVADGICNNLKPVQLDCNDQYTRTTYGEVFTNKFKNLNYCPITVSTFIQPPYILNITNGSPTGADGDLLRILVYGLNASLKMMTPSRGTGWGWRQNNGTWMGSLADVHEDLANFSMTSAAVTLTRFSDFEISSSYFTSQVVWVTHPAQLQNVAMKLTHPFEQDMRIALVVSFCLVVFCAFIIKTSCWTSTFSKFEEDQTSRSVVFYAWMICMGQSVIKLPTRSSFLQMVFIWIWYCFLIRTAYQVYLISSLKGKFYESQFETIDDVINAKYPFGGGAALKDYFIDNPIVYNNWQNIDTPQLAQIAVNLTKGIKFVLAMNSDNAQTVIKNNKIELHILPQKVITSPVVVFFKKYSPLSEPINLILGRLCAAGFPDKLHKVYTSLLKTVDIDTEGETLKIKHFTACYIILILGWIVSAIFYSLEFYFGKIYRHPTL